MSRRPPDMSGAPPLRLALREFGALPQVAAVLWRSAAAVAPSGTGQPVLVLPGMLSGDWATALLRKTFDAAGYRSFPGGLGINASLRTERLAALEADLAQIVERYGRKAIIVGWSLGGFYARVLGQRHGELVELVATLGTPFSGSRRANNVWRLYELLAGHSVDNPPIGDDPTIKPRPYTIAFWSPRDGIVAAGSAKGADTERDEAIELPFGHIEMGVSRSAAAVVVDTISRRIAQQTG